MEFRLVDRLVSEVHKDSLLYNDHCSKVASVSRLTDEKTGLQECVTIDRAKNCPDNLTTLDETELTLRVVRALRLEPFEALQEKNSSLTERGCPGDADPVHAAKHLYANEVLLGTA
ncbi:hypothetical protein SAMD00019534_117800 [Acytostelium subglobosum LB1]|uniref:hypothetical protein n=1 Tax=Acytostelium subglobosum LB1 TaxID=1410327 RepID=UPI0006447F85|nr:hypothetical protein SAMD00019534_117800 [Acytostelium subglobosum LB1]GAM28604.1 hypothetical protein SAMD00019534_117800 [Acytostelium subglobosum LB1]|eukprot:XP_012748382.1 hypothetical protein SAMD00019534_117800 [Acytostelium subglobosum LB1]